MRDSVAAEREALIENIAEADDALVERYLEGETLSEEDLRNALARGTLARSFTPVMCGSSTRNIGSTFSWISPWPPCPHPRQGPQDRQGSGDREGN
jgi:hypothetical protein